MATLTLQELTASDPDCIIFAPCGECMQLLLPRCCTQWQLTDLPMRCEQCTCGQLEGRRLCSPGHDCAADGSLGCTNPQLHMTLCAGFDLKRSAKDLGEAKYLQSAGELPATRCASLVFSLSTLVLSNCTSGVV